MKEKVHKKNDIFSSQLAVKAYLLFMLTIVMIAAFDKPKQPMDVAATQTPTLTLEQQINITVTQLSALLGNELRIRVREKVALQLLITDSSVVLRDCHQIITDMNNKYSKQTDIREDDLFTKQIMKNLYFQESISIITGKSEHPKVITEHIMTSELKENLKRYTIIISTLGKIKDLNSNIVQELNKHIYALKRQLSLIHGDFVNMQNVIADIDELHRLLQRFVNAI